MSVMIIAEAGVNHNGSLDRACELVECAAAAGADAVKFQTFRAKELAVAAAQTAGYQKGVAEKQVDLLSKLELSWSDFRVLQGLCREKGLQFLSSPFGLESLEFLCGDLGLEQVKVASGEITHWRFLHALGRRGVDVFLSTGMATMGEVEEALGVIACGALGRDEEVNRRSVLEAFSSDAGQTYLREKVCLLHCTSEYPAPYGEVGLRVLESLRQVFGLPVGLSDHSEGTYVAMAAVALGAKILEKHFTLDKNLSGPDHKASLDPGELGDLVKGVRAVSLALGDGVKRPSLQEVENAGKVRRSLVALRDIGVGEKFDEQSLGCRRPGDGRSAAEYWQVLGTRAKRAYRSEELID